MAGYGERSLNLLSQSPFNESGFLLNYSADTGQWSAQDPVSQGQGMEGFARAILAGRKLKGVNTRPWEEFLKKACTVHAGRILRDDWKPVNTAEGFFISPLCKGYQLYGNAEFKRAATKAGAYYCEPAPGHAVSPIGAARWTRIARTRKARWAAFQGFLALYELTKEQKYLDWAAHAMDVALPTPYCGTFIYRRAGCAITD